MNCTVHLLAGTYQTYGTGAWNIQSGQKILGSGIDNTIVKLVGGGCTMGVAGNTIYSNIVVADLTVDAGYVGNGISRDGIYLAGSFNTIRNVKVINFGATAGYAEAYGILISYCPEMGTNNCEGNLVENCEIGQLLGTGGYDGIFFQGGSNNWVGGIIRNNHTSSTIRGSWMCNTLIEGNTINAAFALNGVAFFASDGLTNIMVAHNVFENCENSIYIEYATGQNISFCYNTTTISYGDWAIMLYNCGLSDILIVGNYFGCEDIYGTGPLPGSLLYVPHGSTISGMIANNMVDASLSARPQTGVNMVFNYDLQGNLRTDLDTMGFSTMTSFGKSFLASPNYSTALTSLGLPANPAVILTNNQSQPVTFNTNVTVNGTLNYSNMVAQLLAGIGVTTSTLNTPTGQVVTVNANAQTQFTNEVWISQSRRRMVEMEHWIFPSTALPSPTSTPLWVICPQIPRSTFSQALFKRVG